MQDVFWLPIFFIKCKQYIIISYLTIYRSVLKQISALSWYLKLFEENLGEGLPEVRRAKDGLDDHHSSVARVHQQVPD